MVGTFKEVALRWYILPRYSVISYQDLTQKMVQHFSTIKHMKLLITSLFNVRQGRDNEETIKVSHPNQEMFVGAFQHNLKAG